MEKDKVEATIKFLKGKQMRILDLLRPTTQKLVTLVLMSLLWVVPTSKEAIMKGTWEQQHGSPFTFIFLIESTVGGSYNIWISHFLVTSLLADLTILYFVSSIISLALKERI